ADCWKELPKNDARVNGAILGRFVAERVLEARQGDGSDRAGVAHVARNKPGFWQPTAPGFDNALLPEWGYVKPFAIRKGTQYRPANPPALTSAAYADAFIEVKRLGSK